MQKSDLQLPSDFRDAIQPCWAVILRNIVSLEENVSRNTLTFPFFSMKVRQSKRSHLPSKRGEPLVWNIHRVSIVNSQTTAKIQFAGLFNLFISCKSQCAWNEQKTSFLFVCIVSFLFYFYSQACFSLSVLVLYSFFQNIFCSIPRHDEHQNEWYYPSMVVTMTHRFHFFCLFGCTVRGFLQIS